MTDTPAGWDWERAADPQQVHGLLCASDAFQAARSGTPVPARRIDTTERHVRAGAVYLLRYKGEPAAMFTLTSVPPFDLSTTDFPPADSPVHLQRLAVRPDLVITGSLVGARCVRKAIEVGVTGGADVLRSEANPDLPGTRTLLHEFGFRQYGPEHADATGRRWVHLQRDL
jgi:hypothetical protein